MSEKDSSSHNKGTGMKMNKKLILAIMILVLIAINSGYFLWQIDRHEKALLGQEMLIPVPREDWIKFMRERDEYWIKVFRIEKENRDLIDLIDQYKKQDKYPSKLSGFEYFTYRESDILSPVSGFSFKHDNPQQYDNWKHIYSNLFLDRAFLIEPKPTNPHRLIIQQSISSLYRYMIMFDGILVLSLILFLFLYKEPPIIKEESL
jgi:hypothetical protein